MTGVTQLMFGKFTYLVWLTLFIGLPALTLTALNWKKLIASRRAIIWVLIGAAFGGWAWDFTAMQIGFWFFDDSRLIGLSVLGLPIEEWLWILGVAYLFSALTISFETRARSREIAAHATPHPLSICPATLAFTWASLSQISLLLASGVVFHTMLWARNAEFLWARRATITKVTALAVLWLLVTDPIGAAWKCWLYDPDRVIGIWLFGLIPIEDVFGIAIVGSAAACATLVFGFSPRRWI